MAVLPRVQPRAWLERLRSRAEAGSGRGTGGSGLAAVVRKEFADHVSGWRMLILVALLVVTGLGSLYTAAQTIRDAVGLTAAIPEFVFLRLFTGGSPQLPPLTAFVTFLAPLLGIALGFDAVCGEQNRRTLSRILAQPIHRDAVINGKFLAGVLAIVITLTALLAGVGALGLLMLGVPPTGDEALRLVAYGVLTTIYVAFWLALAILFSVVFRQAATSALASISVWLFFSAFWDMLVNLAAGDDPVGLGLWLSRISPSYLYSEAIVTLLNPLVRTLGPVTLEQVLGALEGVLPVGQSLVLVWPQTVGLVALTAVCFAISYILFMRREIRA
ncbi:ABC-2 type transport system permease protein [Symbiobacterium terraclitae]|uniref:ABC-2 type transport system permease protein n=1 Tax=Symbiobacterium terraclitae TaxID=557451 RepID=A0ABS4JU82_9FIRM|nr:ABC transporter permease subunit [Symbiobacterium terraclitae]MBP2019102.1 ABC-2 type transport system permease protein [Symbiobacterium terraclitae]